jgi:hypothetical protein
MRAHASQIPETSFFLSMPEDVFSMVWGQEWYIRVRPEVPASEPHTMETALMLEVDGEVPNGGSRPGTVPAHDGAASA